MLHACVGMCCSDNSRVPRPVFDWRAETSETPVFLALLPVNSKRSGTRAKFHVGEEQELFRQEPQPPVKDKNSTTGAMLHACVGMCCSDNSRVPRPVFDWRAETSETPVFLALLPVNSKRSGTRAKFHVGEEQELFRQEPQPPVKDKNSTTGAMLHACVGMWCSANSLVPMPVFDWRAENIRYTSFLSHVTTSIQDDPGTRPHSPSPYHGSQA